MKFILKSISIVILLSFAMLLVGCSNERNSQNSLSESQETTVKDSSSAILTTNQTPYEISHNVASLNIQLENIRDLLTLKHTMRNFIYLEEKNVDKSEPGNRYFDKLDVASSKQDFNIPITGVVSSMRCLRDKIIVEIYPENHEGVVQLGVFDPYANSYEAIKTVEDDNAAKLNNNVKQTVYTYDSNGNQVKKVADGKTETNTYDGLNQLIGFTDGETNASYKYNVSGLRYEKTVDGQTINHVWDGSKQIIADVIDNQFYEADCYIRGTNLVAKYNYRNGEKSEYTYYTQNAHGDVVNLTDKDGKVTKKYTYDAFGVEKNIDENDTNAFRYCGEYFDTETGTIYLRARYYNPSTGRFISRDSYAGKLNDPLSLNLYTYCHNNPVMYIDPSGHGVISNAT